GVPKEYFMTLLNKTLQEAQNVSSIGLNYGQMDDNTTSVAMIGSGIPLDKPDLQHRTADPTGTLECDEVCVILENGQKSSELSHDELEKELVTQLFATQRQNMVVEKMLKLTDLYNDALDAGKSGKTMEISKCLLPQKYPHFLEKKANKSYHSPSVLGLIYDTVKGYQSYNASRKVLQHIPLAFQFRPSIILIF
nr:RNA-dependent RNA polymerase, eukaryotic-type [Tanacetum cinerariifolium]